MQKAKAIHDESNDWDFSMLGGFMASCDWLGKFMKQNGISLRGITSYSKRFKVNGWQSGNICCPNSKINTEI